MSADFWFFHFPFVATLSQWYQSCVTRPCGTTTFQKKRPKISSNLTWQIELVLAKVPVKKQFRKRSKLPAETTEREHGVKKPERLEDS